MKKVTIYLDESLWRSFRVACVEQGISASQQVLQLITEYLAQHSSKTRGNVQETTFP